MFKNKKDSLRRNRKNIKLTSEFVFWKGKKLIGAAILITSLVFLIFAFLPFPVLTTIHAYTIGALFGFFSPIFYVLTFLFGLLFILEGEVSTWIRIRYLFLWYLFFSIAIFLIGGTIFYLIIISPGGFLDYGNNIWINNFSNWWTTFSSVNNVSNVVLPNTLNLGIIGNLFFSIFTSAGTVIFSVIFATLIISTGVFYLIFGSPISRIQERAKIAKIKKIDLFNYETNVLDLGKEDVLTNEYIKTNFIEFIDDTKELNLSKKKRRQNINVISRTLNLDESDNSKINKTSKIENKLLIPKTSNTELGTVVNNTKSQSTTSKTLEVVKKNSFEFELEEPKNKTIEKTKILSKKEEDSNELVFFGSDIDKVENINEKFLPKSSKNKNIDSGSKIPRDSSTKNSKGPFLQEKVNLEKIEEMFSSNNEKNVLDKNDFSKTTNADITSESIFLFENPFDEEKKEEE
ncbi:MFS transporter [[Mycoplasma] mobile]|uniref:Expressed protein n=1 Tax=Mycoplasma mobile (strain ATCC 43663 / 163K / NCTC 11711) TaxID=267748 RepID=Q6KH23_MYCM1|nr:MFS transporter [[Mycoplasma] mobile]AAT28108.1 expressed protein [Mycoplasma mobile 163K]